MHAQCALPWFDKCFTGQKSGQDQPTCPWCRGVVDINMACRPCLKPSNNPDDDPDNPDSNEKSVPCAWGSVAVTTGPCASASSTKPAAGGKVVQGHRSSCAQDWGTWEEIVARCRTYTDVEVIEAVNNKCEAMGAPKPHLRRNKSRLKSGEDVTMLQFTCRPRGHCEPSGCPTQPRDCPWRLIFRKRSEDGEWVASAPTATPGKHGSFLLHKTSPEDCREWSRTLRVVRPSRIGLAAEMCRKMSSADIQQAVTMTVRQKQALVKTKRGQMFRVHTPGTFCSPAKVRSNRIVTYPFSRWYPLPSMSPLSCHRQASILNGSQVPTQTRMLLTHPTATSCAVS